MTQRRRLRPMLVAAVAAVALLASLGLARRDLPTAQTHEGAVIVFNGEGNNLNAYDADPPFTKQTVITNHDDDPNGLDINAQICFFPERAVGSAGSSPARTPASRTRRRAGGSSSSSGKHGRRARGEAVGKLTPTYQASNDNAENYGCGFLSDGRVAHDRHRQPGERRPRTGSSSCGSRRSTTPRCGTARSTSASPRPGGIYVDAKNRVYVASARPPTAGVLRYTGPVPDLRHAEGGCGEKDATGAPHGGRR